MRRLIINADDFGLTPGVNRAICEAHESGVLTSATLMANARAFDDAVGTAKSAPRLGVGCHIVLVDGRPVLSRADIPSLLATGTQQGNSQEPRFADSTTRFVIRAMRGELDPHQLEAEATAQIRKIQSAGVVVTHFDTHKHTHLLSAVLEPLLRAAKACGLRAVRNPFSPVPALPLAILLSRPALWKRYAQVQFLQGFASRFQRSVREADLFTTDGSLGIVLTGSLDARLFRVIVEGMPDGTWELVCHPGHYDADLQSVRTRLRKSREQELKLLTSPETKHLLLQQAIELLSFRDVGVAE